MHSRCPTTASAPLALSPPTPPSPPPPQPRHLPLVTSRSRSQPPPPSTLTVGLTAPHLRPHGLPLGHSAAIPLLPHSGPRLPPSPPQPPSSPSPFSPSRQIRPDLAVDSCLLPSPPQPPSSPFPFSLSRQILRLTLTFPFSSSHQIRPDLAVDLRLPPLSHLSSTRSATTWRGWPCSLLRSASRSRRPESPSLAGQAWVARADPAPLRLKTLDLAPNPLLPKGRLAPPQPPPSPAADLVSLLPCPLHCFLSTPPSQIPPELRPSPSLERGTGSWHTRSGLGCIRSGQPSPRSGTLIAGSGRARPDPGARQLEVAHSP